MSISDFLCNPDEAVRLRGVDELAQSRADDVVPALVRALDDKSWRVRQEAVRALVQHGSASVGAVLRALHDRHGNLGILNGAIQVLAQAGLDATGEIITFLADADPSLRTSAALTLGLQNDPRAIAPLIRAVDDIDPNVRYHAIEALGRLRASDAVDALAVIAEARDFPLAFPALEALAAIGDSRASFRLLPLLEDELLLSAVLEALGQVGGEEAVTALAKQINKGELVGTSAQALERIHRRYHSLYNQGDLIAGLARQAITPSGIQNLLDSLDKRSAPDLPATAVVLGWLEHDTLDRSLAHLLGLSAVQSEVVAALVRRGPRMTVYLVEQLHAENVAIRQAAALALGRIGDLAAVPALLEIMNADSDMIVAVAGALAMIGAGEAYAPLLNLLGHEDGAVRRAILSSLNSLGHPDMAADMTNLCRDPRPLVRESAVRAAGYMGFPECADSLLECCRDVSAQVRRAAVESLSAMENDRIPAALAAALTDEESVVRAAAARTCEQIDPTDAWPLLQKALEDVDPWVRYYAVRSIEAQQLAPALACMCRLAQSDPAMQVRVAAVDAIGAIGGTDVLPLLLALADAADVDLARAALAALGASDHPDALPPLLASLESTDEAQRLAGVRALGNTGLAEALPALQRVVAHDNSQEVAVAATSALVHFKGPGAATALIELTALPRQRAACVAALVPMTRAHMTEIAAGLYHPFADVRRALVEVLARCRDPESAIHLLIALDDDEAGVRLAALTALALTSASSIEPKLAEIAAMDRDPGVRQAAQARLRR